jgi:hypothetical protein
MSGSKTYEKLSAHERAQREKLAKLGIVIDPENGPSFSEDSAETPNPAIVGSELPDESVEDPGSDADTGEEDIDRYAPIEPVDEDTDADSPLGDDPTPAPKGVDKRIHDAKAAQREMSKAQVKLDAMHANLEQKILLLDSKMKEMKDLRKSLDQVASDFSPADAETVRLYREADEDAFRVMQSVVAPALKAVAELSDRLAKLEAHNADSRADRIFEEIYRSIPKERIDELSVDPVFQGWLSALPKKIQSTYRYILGSTADLDSPADALAVFSHFTRDTGVPTLVNGKAPKRERIPVDSIPDLRTGSSLPRIPEKSSARQTQKPNGEFEPLSIEERSNFKKLIQGIDVQAQNGTILHGAKTQQEKDKLLSRLNATHISVNGSIPQVMGSRY